MPLVDDVRRDREAAERSNDYAHTDGTISAIDAEIRRLEAMSPGEQLLDAQSRQGKLTVEQQRDHFATGMTVKLFDPADPHHPWHTGRIVRFFSPVNNGLSMEDRNGVTRSAPYGDRIRLVGYAEADALRLAGGEPVAVVRDALFTRRHGLHVGDLFAPL